MARCPLLLDDEPPCISRCKVEGEYRVELPAAAAQDMIRACVDSLSDWEEATLGEALSAMERMCLLLRGRAKVPRDACDVMRDVALGTREAVSDLNEPELWELYLRIGDILLSCNDPRGAEETYTDALLLKEDDPEIWNNLGLAKKRLGMVEGARDSYGRAIELDADYPQAWFNLGMLQFGEGKFRDAKRSFMRVVRLDGENPVAVNNLGVLLRKEGLNEEALQMFNKAIDILPDYAKAWHNKGVALLNMGREEQGVKCLYHALKLDPEMKEARDELTKRGYDADTFSAPP